ncbi:hypothetical protein [Hoeflea sp. AS16]|uniref:hypothetical protein n=1 Tax=Hoeflea sp. AS16 TaxID=3135779 RepID=UPI003179ADA4
MDTIQITLAIAAATFAAAVTFAKANADVVDQGSTNPARLAAEASPQGSSLFSDRSIVAGRGVSIIFAD